jgi:SAM-dependent methyltransferase
LGAAAERASTAATPLVRASGERLPFRDGSFAGCRIERVLMHVADPAAFLAETLRCVRPGALLTVYEPDWGSFRVRTDDGDESASWLSGARNPAVGSELWDLVEAAGCIVHDRVEELSVWRSLTVLEYIASLEVSVERSIATGRIGETDARRWLDQQHAREANGEFYSTIAKILIVASKR